MKKTSTQRVSELCLKTGYLLISGGAESYRIEDTIEELENLSVTMSTATLLSQRFSSKLMVKTQNLLNLPSVGPIYR